MVYTSLQKPFEDATVIAFFEYLICNNLSSPSLHNYVSILHHFFGMYGWPTTALHSRKIKLMMKSVLTNNPLKPKVKGVLSVTNLKQLISVLNTAGEQEVFGALFLLGFFGFFRLATLVPSKVIDFDVTRFPLVKDIIWTAKGFQMIIKCRKNMQNADQFDVVHIPKLKSADICPVLATRRLIRRLKLNMQDPLFQVETNGSKLPVTAVQVRKLLNKYIKLLDLNPKDFGFHCFRRSGACLAFELNVPFENIKLHGKWRSDAIWAYLTRTPKAAAQVASTFAQEII